MTRKSLFILVLSISICAACQSVEPADQGATSTQESSLPSPPATLPTNTPSSTKITLPLETSVPDAEIEPSAGGIIAFYSDRDGNPEIYTMNTDGSGLARLTNDPAFDDSPSISPDSTRIAFLTARHDPDHQFPNLKYEIYVMDMDGGNPRRLTNTEASEDHPAWSPDGSKIIFDADYDGDGYYEVYMMTPDGKDVTRLTSNAANDQFADWSPDGSRIAFSSDRSGNWDIYVMNSDGSNQHPLISNSDWELFPAWSPDGSQIAFNGLRPNSGNTDVYIMNADGSNVRQLTDTPRFDENPVWSPDGDQIAYQTQRNGNFEIYIMNADGSEQHPLAAHPANDLWPSWALVNPSIGPSATPVTSLLFEKSAQEFSSPETFQAGLGDLDGDADLDAVFANPQTNSSQVWLNDGSGNFVDTGQQLTPYGHGVGVADFDGDGDLDAFIVCHQFVTPSKIYLNDGNGIFRDTGQDFGDGSKSAGEVNLLDLNGDRHVDVHVLYYSPDGMPDKVYLNDGRANFNDSGLALDEETIAWGDLDGDGDIDYFGKRWGQGYVVQLNNGSGQFSTAWQMDDNHSAVGGIALADFDSDNDLDALVTNGHRQTGSFPSRLFWNNGDGQFTDSGQRLNETMGAELAANDLDLDGDLDVFVANMDLPNEVWLNDGGQFVDSGLRLGEGSDMSGRPSLGDLDGDGDLDVAVGRFQGGAEIWFNLTIP
jgi:TolB protein